jgi:serine/threonine protein kinase
MKTVEKLGKYEIIGEIGRGGFATVYRVRDPDLDREVALKVLDPLLTRDPVWVERFRREARAVARLDHPHVVTIHEVGQAEGLLYIAMRLVEGGSLAQRIAEEGALPWEQVVQLVEEVASALDYAHAQGVIHRDLKSGNVLLDSERGGQLTDFGFARLVAHSSLSVSVTGGVVGTPHYIAPEVWHGRQATPQTDVYALGCILFEMVAGRRLFEGESTPAVMMAHFQPLALPDTWPETVPPGLNPVLERALANDVESRYESAGALAAALLDLHIDELAEPYAALEEALAAEEWQEALDLAGQIRAEEAEYRDVVVLEQQAVDGLEQEARIREAATWRQAAEQALVVGNWQGAELAAQQWAALRPDDRNLTAFRQKLKESSAAEEKATSSTGSSAQSEPPKMRQQLRSARTRSPGDAQPATGTSTTQHPKPSTAAPSRPTPSTERSGLYVSVGVLVVAAIALVILTALVTTAIIIGSAPTPEPQTIIQTVEVERIIEVVVTATPSP